MSKSIHEKVFDIQQELGVIAKNKENPHFKSRYADYPSIWEKVKPLLRRHKLSACFHFAPSSTPDSTQVTLTLRCIESGELIQSVLEMPIAKGNPQAVGSAITYSKRYMVTALLNIVIDDEDDDGNAASKVKNRRPQAGDSAGNDPLKELGI